jgi:pyruvate/2-oxoacid:ferredoxin oxidoreductase beta subunit
VPEEHLHVIEPVPSKHREHVELIQKEIEHRGLSVIIPTRPCIHVKRKQRVASLNTATT